MIIEFEVPIIDTADVYDEIIVCIEGNPRWENDSFSYAGTHCTHGQSGLCKLPWYTILDEDVTWNKVKYNNEQNELIQKWIEANADYIGEKFTNKLEWQFQYD